MSGVGVSGVGKIFQVDSCTSRKYGETGLGLAICKQLSQIMGGTMWVDSEAGVGYDILNQVLVGKPIPVKPASLSSQIDPQMAQRLPGELTALIVIVIRHTPFL
ncbi:MAG: ATP-binding protein [Coleofasciculus sp. B1-GNL1-01]|uniref:ATP-binding protein n=1 Tax=Coleofasciculus sp. B1-GNL1-01 TaxID=3068484 RepID=UPI0032FC7C1B